MNVFVSLGDIIYWSILVMILLLVVIFYLSNKVRQLFCRHKEVKNWERIEDGFSYQRWGMVRCNKCAKVFEDRKRFDS